MKKIKVSHRGRKCKFPSCRIVLSIYNHGCYCYLHQEKAGVQAALKSCDR
ncbi:MAG: hypothetical protein PHH75_07265 [Candidatus Omnitrophica bacterium]|nr:hypothetical protein [Candidatus Omnitrophota bacterium]MDD5574959.1 hypothetical protein [Candidatus Omnitrophota bacterium]